MTVSEETSTPWSFRSGHLALDFANTADWHASDEPVELLNTFNDLLAWARDLDVLKVRALTDLERWASDQPDEAGVALADALALREAVYAIFSAVAGGETPRQRDLDLLAGAFAEAVAHARLAFGGGSPGWSWNVDSVSAGTTPQSKTPTSDLPPSDSVQGKLRPDLEHPDHRAPGTRHLAPLYPIAVAAVELLRSPELDRVGQCRDDRGCGALFLDASRNRSRQWCRMESCGNRAKARRYYARTREE